MVCTSNCHLRRLAGCSDTLISRRGDFPGAADKHSAALRLCGGRVAGLSEMAQPIEGKMAVPSAGSLRSESHADVACAVEITVLYAGAYRVERYRW